MPTRVIAAVFGSSLKENEFRLPIHPAHLRRIPPECRKGMIFETGYGSRFGVSDAELEPLVGGILCREELFAKAELLLIPKPVEADLLAARFGSAVCGWVHCVQQRGMVQAAIRRRLTLLAWESMYVDQGPNERPIHVFHRNNETAGFCAVLHAFQTLGIAAWYGAPRRATVISFGAVSRGAILGLQSLGVRHVTVLTRRRPGVIADRIAGCEYGHVLRRGNTLFVEMNDVGEKSLLEILSLSDVIVNGILQDPDDPWMFMADGDVGQLKRNGVIIDVSCDHGMGFPFARPTTFDAPVVRVGPVWYYGVDHTPSYLWNTTTEEISEALLPFLPSLLGGAEEWLANRTLAKGMEIVLGEIRNARILSFQRRSSVFPHDLMTSDTHDTHIVESMRDAIK